MKKINFLVILLFSLILAGCGESDSQQQSQNQEDESEESIVENAVFTDLDGNEVSVDEFEGKVVLIDFWETWCGPCLQVFPAMQDLREEHPDKFEVLAVTVGLNEGPEDARQFVERNDYDFQFLYDENDIFDRLGGQGIPFKVFIDPDGNLVSIEMGSYGREADYEKTKELIAEYFEIE
ncbi:MAG: TlpA disulfide reductase family protein [Balneolaceae bacterium]|nr:TlpA disulfide reductase family protein [Balneolaceae bacterium]